MNNRIINNLRNLPYKPSMKYISVVLYLCIIFCQDSLAQYVNFPTHGVIEFEKKVNTHAVFRRFINKDNESYVQKAFDAHKKNNPQFKTFKSTLTFNGNNTLFTPLEDQEVQQQNFMSFHPYMNQINNIYSDLTAGTFINQKKIFDQNFLVKDTIRNVKWKITDETREIAGYMCRRANGIMLDSIYVVAFYTDKIPVSGGPESFAGLPGMILGVALPHENITWFAKTVTEKPGEALPIKIPSKGKVQTTAELKKTILNTAKDWGDSYKELFKAVLL